MFCIWWKTVWRKGLSTNWNVPWLFPPDTPGSLIDRQPEILPNQISIPWTGWAHRAFRLLAPSPAGICSLSWFEHNEANPYTNGESKFGLTSSETSSKLECQARGYKHRTGLHGFWRRLSPHTELLPMHNEDWGFMAPSLGGLECVGYTKTDSWSCPNFTEDQQF